MRHTAFCFPRSFQFELHKTSTTHRNGSRRDPNKEAIEWGIHAVVICVSTAGEDHVSRCLPATDSFAGRCWFRVRFSPYLHNYSYVLTFVPALAFGRTFPANARMGFRAAIGLLCRGALWVENWNEIFVCNRRADFSQIKCKRKL